VENLSQTDSQTPVLGRRVTPINDLYGKRLSPKVIGHGQLRFFWATRKILAIFFLQFFLANGLLSPLAKSCPYAKRGTFLRLQINKGVGMSQVYREII